MLAEEDRLGWVGAGMVCTWYVLSVVYLREVLIVWKCCLGMYKPNSLQGEGM